MSVDQGGRAPETLLCHACGLQCANPRALAVHMERHRPVDPPTIDPETKREKSHGCSAGCGRNFLSLAQYREHAPTCDGQAPIEPFLDNRKSDGQKGRAVECPECGVPYTDLEVLAVHLERHREVLEPVHDPRTNELMSKPCPKYCGRNFLSKREYKEHTELCDGSKPLPAKKSEEAIVIIDDSKSQNDSKAIQMAEEVDLSRLGQRKEGDAVMKMKCTACDPPRDFTRPGPFAMHLKRAHNMKYERDGAAGAAPRARRKPRKDAAEPERPVPAARPTDSVAPGTEDVSVTALKEKAKDLRRRADRLDEISAAVGLLMKEAETLL